MRSSWQKPITNKRYLHPPKSEKLYTLWPEGKLVFGDVEPADEQEDLYDKYVSSGLWFVRGNINGEIDFHNTEFINREDGIPIHAMKNLTGGLEFFIEAFSSFERRGRCFASLTVKNCMDRSITENIGFLLRTARECELVKHSPSHYRPFSPEVIEWHKLNSTWKADNRCFRYGENYVIYDCDRELSFIEKNGVAYTSISLSPGESWTIRIAYGEGETLRFDYDEERKSTIVAWQRELDRLNNIPIEISSDGKSLTMVNHLVTTLLQHFCYPSGCDYMIVRQGGLHRMIWPYEAMPVLEALTRLGNFDDYVEPIIDMYFEKCQIESGEIVPFGVRWAMCTSCALTSFAKYALTRGKEYFDKYRDRTYKAFLWIKNTRVKEKTEGIVKGLFPPLRSSDDALVFQNYGSTDTHNLEGLRQLYRAFSHFEDPAKEELRNEVEDYNAVLQNVWKGVRENASSDELRVSYTPIGDDTAVREAYGFSHTGAYISNYLDISTSDVEKIINYYTKRGFIKGGLYNKLPDKIAPGVYPYYLDENGRCLIWYIGAHEYSWFKYFMRHDMKERAKEIIDDCIRFGMTKDYYMVERYNERDPYFGPWMPNASANGRLLNMLLDYYL